MQSYIGQILLFAFPRVPDGWAVCDGSLQRISDNPTLYQLIGTTYGGDGVNTFALPDLRGRVPLHWGQGNGLTPRFLGEKAGTETVTLVGNNLPSHNHQLQASPSTTAASATPGPTVEFATAVGGVTPYASSITGATPEVLAGSSIGMSGGNQPHNNMMPTLIMNYCISLYGVYPPPP
jgi:microcystin-dependent protein